MTIHSCDLCGLWPFCLLLELDDHGTRRKKKWTGGCKMSQTSQEPSVMSQSSQGWTVACVTPGCFCPCCGCGYGVLRKQVLLHGAKDAHSPGIREVPGGSMRRLNLLAGYCLMAHREGQWVTTTVCQLQNGHCFTRNFSHETLVVHPKRKHTRNGSSGKHIQPWRLTHQKEFWEG